MAARNTTEDVTNALQRTQGAGAGAGAGASVVKTDYESVISTMARVNKSDIVTEENFYLLKWIYLIRRASCARGLRVGFLQPDFLCVIYGPMMRSKKLRRANKDIRAAVDLWCTDRAAALKRYGHISDWDVSSVTNMNALFRGIGPYDRMEDRFRGKDLFNDDISRWDVSNVTDMANMFACAGAFNQPIGCWDVSKVTSMPYMFSQARAFSQPIGDWDVSNVIDTSFMFFNATSFNQDLTRWDMRSVRPGGNDQMFTYTHRMRREYRPAAVGGKG
jgi:surface protein